MKKNKLDSFYSFVENNSTLLFILLTITVLLEYFILGKYSVFQMHDFAGDVFPNTLRAFGKETRSQLNGIIEDMVYEALLNFDAETSKLEPELATHWRVLDDSMTFLFRINPNARFSDGREVTAKDVVSTYDIRTDEGHGDPNVYTFWRDKFDRPVAESKYIVSVKSKEKEWRNLYWFSELHIYPSYYLYFLHVIVTKMLELIESQKQNQKISKYLQNYQLQNSQVMQEV